MFFRKLILISLLTFSGISCFADGGDTDTIVFKGNYFEVASAVETLMVEDPITQEVELVVANPNPIPIKMNGYTIYTDKEIDTPPSLSVEKLKRYLLYQLGTTLTGLGNGMYRMYLDNVIIDDKGKVAYYTYGGVQYAQKPMPSQNNDRPKSSMRVSYKVDWQNLPEVHQQRIKKKLEVLIEKMPAYSPAKAYNQPVIYRMEMKSFPNSFEVDKGHLILK